MKRLDFSSLLTLCVVMLFASAAVRAEDANPPAPPAPGGGAPGGGRTDRGNRFGGRGNWQGGGGGNPMDMVGAMFGRGTDRGSGVLGMVSRMVGTDVTDPKAEPKLDQLPLGDNKHLVTEVPIGGVDNFSPTGAGWKVEAVFKMTPEQTKATEALRDEYTTEEKKLNQEIQDAEKALAAKVVDLRQKYEKKANEILTGADKEAKEKMDALSAETRAKNSATVAETLPLYDTKDFQQGMTMVRALREKINKNNQDAEDKLMTLIPEDNRPKLQEALKAQQDARSRATQMMQNFGNGGGMRQRGGGGPTGNPDTVKPPHAPEGDKF